MNLTVKAIDLCVSVSAINLKLTRRREGIAR